MCVRETVNVWCVAVCCGVLQYVAVCCSVLQCVAVCCVVTCVCKRLSICIVLQCAEVCCSMLQYVAVCCSVLQCVAEFCSVLQCVAECCSVLQCVAVCCVVTHGCPNLSCSFLSLEGKFRGKVGEEGLVKTYAKMHRTRRCPN